MFLLNICEKCKQSFVAFLLMLFCSVSWAGIDIINEGRAFTSEVFREPWSLNYSLPGTVICEDIRDKYNEVSFTQYQSKPNIVISRVLRVSVDVIQNTTLFSIDTNEPAFIVYLGNVVAPSAYDPVSPLLIFKNKSVGGDEIRFEMKGASPEEALKLVVVPWVTVETERWSLDEESGVGAILYSRYNEMSCKERTGKEGRDTRRGEVYAKSFYICDSCRAAKPYGADPCNCCFEEFIETHLSFSFRVLNSTDTSDIIDSSDWVLVKSDVKVE